MANVAIPRNDCGVGLDDLERVCAVCWGGHDDDDDDDGGCGGCGKGFGEGLGK
jgi:hypothetical protein